MNKKNYILVATMLIILIILASIIVVLIYTGHKTIRGDKDSIGIEFQPHVIRHLESISSQEPIVVETIELSNTIINIHEKNQEGIHEASIMYQGTTYKIGEISFDLSMIDCWEITVDEKEYAVLNGGLGAAYPIQYYIDLSNNILTIPIDAGLPVVVADINKDGCNEWVSSYNGQTTLYYINSNKWYIANLNNYFDHISYIESQNIFQILSENRRNITSNNKYEITFYRLDQQNQLVQTKLPK